MVFNDEERKECCYTFPTKDVDGNKIEKSLDEYNDEEKKEFQLNSKVMYILACAMDRTEFNIICQCKTAKKVWRILVIKDQNIGKHGYIGNWILQKYRKYR